MISKKEKKAVIRKRNKKHQQINFAEKEHREAQEEARQAAEEARDRDKDNEGNPLPSHSMEISPDAGDRDLSSGDRVRRIRVRLERKRSAARALWHDRISSGGSGRSGRGR